MKPNKILFKIIIIFSILSSFGCQNSGTATSSNPQDPTTTKQIDSMGGSVELYSNGSSAAALIPEESLKEPENIKITFKKNLPKSLPQNSIQAGECINFGPEGLIFDKNITLGVPYKDIDNDGIIDSTNIAVNKIDVKYFDPIANAWTNMVVKKIDTSVNIAYFETNHFSTYIAFVDTIPTSPTDNSNLYENQYFIGEPYFYKDSDGETKLYQKGCINRPDLPCGEYWHLSIFRHVSTGAVYIVDRFFTNNPLGGNHVTLSEDGTSITFDAQKIFDKVKQSGDARLWDWQSDFVLEHTKLLNYVAISDDDPTYLQAADDEKIYSNITAIDNNNVRIFWKINIIPEIKPGKTLCIKFEARYKPNGV